MTVTYDQRLLIGNPVPYHERNFVRQDDIDFDEAQATLESAPRVPSRRIWPPMWMSA